MNAAAHAARLVTGTSRATVVRTQRIRMTAVSGCSPKACATRAAQPEPPYLATATAIAAGDLSQRVPDVAPGTEAGALGVALNQMMGRIEEAFDERTRSENRLRRFAADVRPALAATASADTAVAAPQS